MRSGTASRVEASALDGKTRILIVEDQPEVLELMVLALTRAGCEVVAAADGKEGMRRAEDGAFDLISTDLDMPELDGFELCSRLKQNPALRHTPIVIVSGRTGDDDLRRGRELGAADFITKPFDLASFTARILALA